MEKERDPNYEDQTETSLVLKDERFSSIVQEVIEKSIDKGAKPLGAALEAKISKNLFISWMQIDDFREWIEGLVELHLSRKRMKINTLLDVIEGDEGNDGDPIKACELNMKYLQNADKEFGSKHQKITSESAGKGVLTPESRSKVDKAMEDTIIVREATKIANKPDNS